jgi:hypothetical protein
VGARQDRQPADHARQEGSNAGKSIDKLSTAVGQTGAEVVGGLEIKRNFIDQHTDLFVERLLGVVETA